VLDPAKDFEKRCNPALVDLEGLTDPDEISEVRDLVTEHERRTGSLVAARLLKDWDARLGEFTKVMPRDYRQALRVRFEEETMERLAAAGANWAGGR
jgi:glutamate synthase (NADPH) large chain